MENSISQPLVKRLADYTPYGFAIKSIDLSFELSASHTKVINRLEVQKLDPSETRLVLDGQELELVSVTRNGVAVGSATSDDSTQGGYELTDEDLVIPFPDEEALIEIVTYCDPERNKSLEGLYFAASSFCTQCEAEGFRKITYFPDRPDVLSVFTVTITADKAQFPYLLSNGNKVGSGDLDDGRHWVRWQDPFKKPCYLFALVAGDFDVVTDRFETQSGRSVALELYVDKGNGHRGDHAIESLKKAMRWDEETFGLEYDLDIYMIVAVDFFNMGAMENKGLNVFNSKYVLADRDSATDVDFFNIESIIAHEYFHNWTGNRVTCRDWFQLSLKEGLTVFRDQQFSSDMSSPVTNRLSQVKIIRELQFAEDAGPMAHPIRPVEVIEMNNFYTVTVYDKGAEVIRMMHTLLGVDGFRKGMDLYFERHDGQAVTCDDFVQAMEDASGIDLSLFRRWYSQSGTPVVEITKKVSEDGNSMEIAFAQHHPVTADQSTKQNLHIPIAWERFNHSTGERKSGVFSLKSERDSLVLDEVSQDDSVVFFTDFSAPVKAKVAISFDELLNIMLYANDGFSRWDAAQTVYSELVWSIANNIDNARENAIQVVSRIVEGLMAANETDFGLLAELFSLPGMDTLGEQVEQFDILALYDAREAVKGFVANALREHFHHCYQLCQLDDFRYHNTDVNKRRLKNQFLAFWVQATGDVEQAVQQYKTANNMTDKLGALQALQTDKTLSDFDSIMTDFEQQWHDDVLVLDKWFSLNATTDREDILPRLDLLTAHQHFNFDNPNRVRSVVGTFAFYNYPQFHKADGSGYAYVANNIIRLNDINPQVASRIITPFLKWRKQVGSRREMMQTQLVRIADTPDLSKDLYEKVSKSLSEG